MKAVQKGTFYSNIDFFLKKRGIKKTDLEREAGVSQGYLSRFSQKDDPDVFPSVSFLEYCSRKFGVAMDDLVNVKFEEMSSTEESIYKFIRKLIDETREDELQWTEHTRGKIRTYINESESSEWDEFALDPISRPHDDNDLPNDEVVFDPAKDLNGDGTVDGSMYETMLNDFVRVFFLPISTWDDVFMEVEKELTLWMEETNTFPKRRQCVARGNDNIYKAFLPVLKELQEAIKDRQKHLQIDREFKDIIHDYLNSELPGLEYGSNPDDYD